MTFSKTVCSVGATILNFIFSGSFLLYALLYPDNFFLIHSGVFIYLLLLSIGVSICVQRKKHKKLRDKSSVRKIGDQKLIEKSLSIMLSNDHRFSVFDFGRINNLEIDDETIFKIINAQDKLIDPFSYASKAFRVYMYKKENRLFKPDDVVYIQGALSLHNENECDHEFDTLLKKIKNEKMGFLMSLVKEILASDLSSVDQQLIFFLADCLFGNDENSVNDYVNIFNWFISHMESKLDY